MDLAFCPSVLAAIETNIARISVKMNASPMAGAAQTRKVNSLALSAAADGRGAQEASGFALCSWNYS